MNLDAAIAITIETIKSGSAAKYGYDVDPSQVANHHAWSVHRHDGMQAQALEREVSGVFRDAAWQLCRRGYLRPGVRQTGDQATDNGGYSFVVGGREAIEALDNSGLVLTQPSALARTLDEFGTRYGEGFRQRSQEAIACRSVEAWLACCAMTGGAAESVLLATAIQKTGDEDLVLSEYKSGRGRSRIENRLVGSAPQWQRDTLKSYTGIISYWRDEAGHGQFSEISAANADEALRQLLLMCQWIDSRWDDLTKNK